MVNVGLAIEAMCLCELERSIGCVHLRSWRCWAKMCRTHAGDVDVGVACELRGSHLDIAENVVPSCEEVFRDGG